MKYQETQESICRWADETFGEVDADTALVRMGNELDELLDDLLDRKDYDAAKEFIDVFVTGVRWLRCLGIDFQDALDAKMAINRARRWKSNGDGTGQHIPEKP